MAGEKMRRVYVLTSKYNKLKRFCYCLIAFIFLLTTLCVYFYSFKDFLNQYACQIEQQYQSCECKTQNCTVGPLQSYSSHLGWGGEKEMSCSFASRALGGLD